MPDQTDPLDAASQRFPQTMTPDEYFERRVQGQINWYDKKSQAFKKKSMQIQTSVIVFSALIPLLSGLSPQLANAFHLADDLWFRVLVGVFGVMVAVLTGVLGLQRYRELWVLYRGTVEALQTEYYRFINATDPYTESDEDKRFRSFVNRFEALLNQEHESWLRHQVEDKSKRPSKGGGQAG